MTERREPLYPASEWDTYYAGGGRFRPVSSTELDELHPHYTTDDRRRILDIGCGTGELASVLFSMGHDVTGLDFSPEAIRAAVANRPGPGYLLADADQDGPGGLDGLAGPYDLILCRLVIQFITDLDAFMRRVNRLLAPGGAFYVVTPIADDLPDDRRTHAQTRAEIAAMAAAWTSSDVREFDGHAQLTLSGLWAPTTERNRA